MPPDHTCFSVKALEALIRRGGPERVWLLCKIQSSHCTGAQADAAGTCQALAVEHQHARFVLRTHRMSTCFA